MTITATPDVAASRVFLELDITGDPATVTVYRVEASGEILGVRNAEPMSLVSGVGSVYDYEATLDTVIYYEVWDGIDLLETSDTLTLDSDGLTWLKHPGNPGLNTVVVPEVAPSTTHPIDMGIIRVLGRRRPVVVSQRRNSEVGDLVLNTGTDDERNAIMALIEDGVPLLFSAPVGYGVGSIYLAVSDVKQERVGDGKACARQWVLPFTVVDRPVGAAAGYGNTWADVLATHATWRDVLTVEGTWSGVLAGVDSADPGGI